VLSFSWKDYLRIYYGKPGPFRGQQALDAKKALRGVAGKKVRIAYYRRKGNDPTNRKWIQDRHNLVIVQQEPGKSVTVAYHPIFIDNIHSFHTWKPINLYQIVADHLKTKKVKKSVILFIEWLLTKDDSIYKIAKKDLIERLWLIKTFKDDRQKSRVKRALTECFETAKGLGYLKSNVTEDEFGNLHLELNPEKCRRIIARKKNKPKD
jgi:hypothetical protein